MIPAISASARSRVAAQPGKIPLQSQPGSSQSIEVYR